MTRSKIEWTDAVWNPIAGCTKVSAGCKHCYAERMAKRCAAMGQAKYIGTVDDQGRWTGKINFDEAALVAPLRWKKPRMVFVNSMSDLFHEGVPDKFVDRVFAVMALCPQHTFQVLTKRPERMAEYLNSPFRVGDELHDAIQDLHIELLEEHEFWSADHDVPQWPLPNVWLGASVENQEQANKRIPWLLKCPAAVRFLSCEPLLGAVQLDRLSVRISATSFVMGSCLGNTDGTLFSPRGARGRGIDWVICGGESGHGAGIRPMHPDWARGLRDQCVAAGVPFFFKQWGNFQAVYDRDHDPDWVEVEHLKRKFPRGRWVNIEGGHGFHGERLHWMVPVGKKSAGRVLDGFEWNEMPDVAREDAKAQRVGRS
jgi:protein gp37